MEPSFAKEGIQAAATSAASASFTAAASASFAVTIVGRAFLN